MIFFAAQIVVFVEIWPKWLSDNKWLPTPGAEQIGLILHGDNALVFKQTKTAELLIKLQLHILVLFISNNDAFVTCSIFFHVLCISFNDVLIYTCF